MKDRTKFALAGLILLILFILAVGAVGFGSSYVLAEGRFHRGHGSGLRHLASELQLTEEQRTEIKNIFAESREAIRPLYRELREKRRLFREAARSEPFDEALARYHAQELADVQAEVLVARAQLFNEALSLLTPEQRTKLDELREERRRRFKERRKQHFNNPDAGD